MKPRIRWGLFSYLIMDYKAAQAYLNRMAQQGWALKRVWFQLFAQFESTDRTDLAYFVDWIDQQRDEAPSYLQLCSDAGWQLRQTVRYMNLYASVPGRRPDPVQTNSRMEYQRFCKKVLFRIGISLLLVALQLFLQGPLLFFLNSLPIPIHIFQTRLALLSMNWSSFLFLTALPLLVGLALYAAFLGYCLIQWRQASQEGPLPTPSAMAAKVRAVLALLGWVWCLILFFMLMLDATLLKRAAILPLLILLACMAVIYLFRAYCTEGVRRKMAQQGWALCTLFLGVILAGRLWFSPALSRLMPTVPSAPILAGDTVTFQQSEASFLLSHFRWSEAPFDGTEQNSIWVEGYVCRTASAAALALDSLWVDGLSPVAGYSQVWSLSTASEDTPDHTALLIRRGNCVVYVAGISTEMPSDLVDHLLYWFDRKEVICHV